MNRTQRILNTRVLLSLLILAVVLVPMSAQAHFGVNHSVGFMHGFAHPLGGLDHLAAMVAVGFWATQLGGRALWTVPLTFVVAMILGGVIGTVGLTLPFVEQGIAYSVLVLGVLIAAAIRLPVKYSAALVGLFALLHGYAHGVEMPSSASGLYGVGFVVATALLNLNGMAIGLFCQQSLAKKLRLTQLLLGGAFASVGLSLCLA